MKWKNNPYRKDYPGHYTQEFVDYLSQSLEWIKSADDCGTVTFECQRLLELLLAQCPYKINGIPSIVDEQGGI